MAVLPTSGRPAPTLPHGSRLCGDEGREPHPGSPWFNTEEAHSTQGIVKTEPSGASSCRGSSLGGDVLEPGSRGRLLSCRSRLTPSGTQLAGPHVWDMKSSVPGRTDTEPEFCVVQ